jgi:hypothetical protein
VVTPFEHAVVEALEIGIVPGSGLRCLDQEKTQEPRALFRDRADALSFAAGSLQRVEPDVSRDLAAGSKPIDRTERMDQGQCREQTDTGMSQQTDDAAILLGEGWELTFDSFNDRVEMINQAEPLVALLWLQSQSKAET